MAAEYCPTCICELIKEKLPAGQKKFKSRKWIVCPKCGFRKEPEKLHVIRQTSQEFSENIKEINEKDF